MKVWLTRTRPGAERQAADLEAAGHEPLVAPVLEIEALGGEPPAESFQWVIFLSEHAVRHGLPALGRGGQLRQARVLAVGRRTAEVLEREGVDAGVPDEPTSEGLLAMPELERMGGQGVLLVRGAGGRRLLADELSRRGARVATFECYRRVPLGHLEPAVLECDAIIAASGEGLETVAGLWFPAGGRADVPVLVPTGRVARLGVELGFQSLHDCRGADSAAWLRCLEQVERD